ncbi:MAG: hypothetical protein ACM3XN_06030 [Chloroflexota bacterium]
MHVWNLRRPGFRIAAAAVVLLALLSLSLRLDARDRYSATVLVELTWGEGDGQVALIKGPSGSPSTGPASFALSNGHIYLLDGGNERILCFDKTGAAAGSLPLPAKTVGEAVDVACDAKGAVYVLATKGVFRIGPDGPVPAELQLPPCEGEAAATNLWIDRQGAFYLRQLIVEDERYVQRVVRCQANSDDAETISLAVLASDGNYAVDAEAFLPTEVNDLAFGPGGEYYVEGRVTDPFARIFSVYRRSGQLVREVVLRQDKYIRDSSLMGVDSKGGFAVGLNLSNEDATVDKVRRDGVVTATWQPGAATVRANVYGRMAANGDVYLLRGTAEKCVIDQYRCQRSWAIVPRWSKK